jgi:hypothetical protein
MNEFTQEKDDLEYLDQNLQILKQTPGKLH